jgi:ribokinase
MLTVVGSVLVDIMSYGERIPVPGETVTGYKYQITPGGKGANQAAAAARLGVETYFIGKMSGCDRLAEVLWEGFTWAGVKVDHVQIVSDVNCGVGVIMVDRKSQNLITIVLGPNALLSPEDVDAKMDVIKKSKIMATEFGIPLNTSEHATIQCRKAGLLTIVTPGPAVPMSDAFYRSTAVIVPNETEAEILTGVKVGDSTSAEKAATIFHRRGVENVIITMGCKGAFVSDGKRHDLLGSIRVKAVDSTGAGDGFIGGLACGLDEGKDIFEAAAYANIVAGLSVTRPGTMRSMASRQEVEEFMRVGARPEAE